MSDAIVIKPECCCFDVFLNFIFQFFVSIRPMHRTCYLVPITPPFFIFQEVCLIPLLCMCYLFLLPVFKYVPVDIYVTCIYKLIVSYLYMLPVFNYLLMLSACTCNLYLPVVSGNVTDFGNVTVVLYLCLDLPILTPVICTCITYV